MSKIDSAFQYGKDAATRLTAEGAPLNRAEFLGNVNKTIKNTAGAAKEFLGKALKFSFNPAQIGKVVPGHLGLIVAAGGLVAGVAAFASAMRTGAEANNALRMKGNHMGSIWWSSAQTALHGTTLASIAGLGLLAPSFLCAFPLLPLIPSVTAIGMDHFQDLCTNPNSWINRLGQFGLDNALVDTKAGQNMFTTYMPKSINFWNDHIRAKDEEFAKNFFGVELDRAELGLAKSNSNYFLA